MSSSSIIRLTFIFVVGASFTTRPGCSEAAYFHHGSVQIVDRFMWQGLQSFAKGYMFGFLSSRVQKRPSRGVPDALR